MTEDFGRTLQPNTAWAKIDPTLWNKAFTGHARAQQCQYCFSLTHKFEDCDLVDAPSTSHVSKLMPSSMPTKPTPSSCTAKICYAWNHSLEAACAFPNCAYQHICLYCANDDQIIHKTTRRYTASAGGAMALEATGNLLLHRLPTTTGSPLPLPALLSLKNQTD